jgi:capsule assembly protein Wzi
MAPGTKLALCALAALPALTFPDFAHAQFGLITLPLNDPAYTQLAALERLGCAAARVSPNRPYQVGAIRSALEAARTQRECVGPLLAALRARFAPIARDTLPALRAGGEATVRATGLSDGVIRPLWENVRPTGDGTPPLVGELEPRVTWDDGHHVAVVVSGFVETSGRNDPTLPADEGEHDRVAANLDETYLTAGAGAFSVVLGRGSEAWLGSGNDSYALSANGPPMDRLAIGFRTAHFEGRSYAGLLNDVTLDSAQDGLAAGIQPLHFYRWLFAHQITWRPDRILEMTVGETSVSSRGNRAPDLLYLNPFVPYLIIQHDSGRVGDDARDNLIDYFAIRSRAGPVTLDAELYVDDIQIDAADRAKTPDQLGWRLVADTPVPIIPTVPIDAEVEYQRSDSYLYMRRFYNEVQQFWNEPIGSDLGPDADYLRLGAEAFPLGALRIAGDIGRWRRGLLRIDTRPAAAPENAGNPPFPTNDPGHPVQTAYLGDLSAQWLTRILPITLSFSLARVTNVNNLPTPAQYYAQTQLSMTYAFRYP